MIDEQLSLDLTEILKPSTGAEAGPDGGPEAERPPEQRLTNWLCSLVWSHDYGRLADLRRPEALSESRLRAASFSPEEAHRPVFEKVAFLFARYHAGRSAPQAGYGSMGDALRRIGSPAGRGPNDPGARRLLDRLVASRELPVRHLQHAVERARACEVAPPSWARLAVDLSAWKAPRRATPYSWARAFYTPEYSAKKNG
ncbi:CRISPR-associated protein Cse2 family [Streptomyces sp. 1114.5]|uniref:type I-E CRISPR-associated protein Cse2/CasB n=1 Tax=Streptomyces sp. 1114.5 TaxID=1938830 RepID=UPI000F243EF4|nr:type I-E CRISPR-associated protein Cse2/CasB [Streptomyces sp. 1114.5]RKT09507.1 CRISPR-associated protein Cse2 family [Streptomyces sp. 1114.5]